MKRKIIEWLRNFAIPRREFDVAIAHRDAARNVSKELSKEIVRLEEILTRETHFKSELIIIPFDPETFRYRVVCEISKDVIRYPNFIKMRHELCKHVANEFHRKILAALEQRYPQ